LEGRRDNVAIQVGDSQGQVGRSALTHAPTGSNQASGGRQRQGHVRGVQVEDLSGTACRFDKVQEVCRKV
jgi:hypothetical protein